MSYQDHIAQIQNRQKGINPYIDELSIDLIAAKNGQCEMRMPVTKRFFQGAGVLQGGIAGSLADEAMAYALLSKVSEEQIIATVDIGHTHLAPIFDGILTARAKIIKIGKRMAFLECIIENEKKQPVLRSNASFMILARKS